MQRVGLWAAIGIGICITVGLLTAEPGYAGEKDHEPTCTLKTLKGRYLFGGIATLSPSSTVTAAVAIAVAGYHTFNGDGTGTDIVTVQHQRCQSCWKNFVTPIAYTVNPRLYGHLHSTRLAGASFGIFIAPNGEELIVIGTTPGSVSVQGPNRRVSRK